MPSTRPRSAAGNTEVRIAMPVPKIMALPNPWSTRNAMSACADGDTASRSDDAVKTPMPQEKTRFRPWMSASLPKGTRNTAAESRYAVGTQLMSTALMWNSLPMAGSAILTEETVKGVRNADRVAIRRVERFKVTSSVMAEMPMRSTRTAFHVAAFDRDQDVTGCGLRVAGLIRN